MDWRRIVEQKKKIPLGIECLTSFDEDKLQALIEGKVTFKTLFKKQKYIPTHT